MVVVRSESKKYATLRNVLLTGGAASALTLGMAPVAIAQDTVEKVTVTGTRIPQKNLQTTSPVTQVTAADVDAAGITRLEDLTNELPQVMASQNSTVSNGATGSATVNLRGLGSARTLVLINGRRMPYGNPFTSAADINQIPGQLVDRIEVLTGGASAVYGSDAVAGVVNFIMRKDYEGVQIDAQYGFYSHHNDFEGAGFLREVIAARAATNPNQFALPQDDVNDGIGKEITGVIGVGSADDRGNITAYMSYRTNDPILQRDRDFSACSLGAQSTAAVAGVPAGALHWTCGGSGTANPGTFTDFGLNSFDPIIFGAPLIDNQTAQDAPSFNFSIGGPAGFRPFVAAQDQFNFGPYNFFQRPDERYALGSFMHYQIDEQIEAYAEVMFTDYRTFSQIAPSGNFFSTGTVNCANPLLSAAQRLLICGDGVNGYRLNAAGNAVLDLGADNLPGGLNTPGPNGIFGNDPATTGVNEGADDVINTDALSPCSVADLAAGTCVVPLYIGRRNQEGGGRQDDLNYQSYRMAGGFRGELLTGLDYDIAMIYSKVNLSRTYKNDFSITRLNRAIDVVDADPGPGVDPQCRSAVDGTDPACVPYNVFALGGVTPAALNYLQVPLLQRSANTQWVSTASLNADLGTWGVKSPYAETPVQAVLGAEFRRDELTSTTDENFSTGNASGQGGPTLGLSGSVDVTEYFGELQVPLLEGQPFAHQVGIDLAYRYSDYDTGVTTDSWKIGVDWAPVEDIRFRASKQRAVRAANIIELFTSQGFNLFDMDDDPCDALDPGGNGVAPAANCQGLNPWQVTPAQAAGGGLNSPAGQYNFLQGGNPALDPEVADTKTLGFVFTPTFLDNFVMSVDWFNIFIEDTIATTGAVNTVASCYFNGDLGSCGRITRNPGTGQLWIGSGVVEDLNTNIGSLETTGIDVNAAYKFDLDMVGLDGSGAMRMELIGTFLDELITDPGAASGAAPYDCAGKHGGRCNATVSPVNPEWRHRMRATWQTPWDADLNLTWRHFGEVVRDSGAVTEIDYTFKAENYFDVSASIGLPLNSTLRVGVNNVFDNDPPLSDNVGTTGNGNTYPQTYESRGRWVFMGITVDM